MNSTQVHALFLPEILNSICDLSGPLEWLSLMTTCRAIFPIVVPYIWKTVDDVQNLISLLELKQNSNQSAPTVDFTRFDIYAPFVKHLNLYGRTSQYFRGELREQALSRARREPLLPNLESITMHISDLQHDSDSLMWIELLLSSSLTRLDFVPTSRSEPALLSYPATRLVIQRVASASPNIKQLVAYPGDIAKDTSDSGEAIDSPHVLWIPHVQQSLASLTNLRDITSSIMIVDGGGLAALGTLPRLERLSMYGSEREYPKHLELHIPENSFPMLSDLTMLKIDPVSMVALMSVEPFVRRLTSLSLSQTFQNTEYSLKYQDHEWLKHTMPRLLKHTACLKRFTYNAGSYSAYVPRGAYFIDRTSLLEYMAPLPLEYVSLSGLSFEEESFFQYMPFALPKLKELRIPEQRVPFDKLDWFTRIPQLNHLTVYLSFSPLPKSWGSSNSPLETLEDTADAIDTNFPSADSADQVGSYLLTLFPNLRRIFWPHYGSIKMTRGYLSKYVKRYLQFMNRIAQVVGTNETRAIDQN